MSALSLLTRSMEIDDVKHQLYELTAHLIDRLQLVQLWGYGFPSLPFYVFAFRHYLEYSTFPPVFSPSQFAPELRVHFESVGFDLSIFVSRWFIPLFSNSLPFTLLFRLWDFLFVVGVSGLFRIAMSLLLLFRGHIVECDLIQLSEFIHDMGHEHLRKESDIQRLFSVLFSLTEVPDETPLNE